VAEVVVLSDLDAVTQEAAQRWLEIANAAVTERGEFTVALAGGNTPRPLYERMATSPWSEQAPWGQTFIFFGDERRVPPDHADSNYWMAHEALLKHVPIPMEQVFRMDGQGLARSAVREYQRVLERHFALARREFPRFDLVLLGMGADGHTASIFPGTRAVSDLTNMVVAYDVPQLGVERITLGLSVINNARHIIFLVSGQSKASALESVLHGEYRPSTYPAQAVKPHDGSLTFLVDREAASDLPK
jgi:6-phosphogluconolactonase